MGIIVSLFESLVFWVILILVFALVHGTMLFIVDGINYYLRIRLLSWIAFFGLIWLSLNHIYYMAVHYPHKWDGWYGVLLIFGYYFVFSHFYGIGRTLFEKNY